MRIKGIYIGAGLGATAYEVQIHKLVIRILRPKLYFWPYRHFLTGKLVFPEAIGFRIYPVNYTT